jgi:hypothetical protein
MVGMLNNSTSITRLVLDGCSPQIPVIQALPTLPSLRGLSLSMLCDVDSPAVHAAMIQLTSLTSLNLSSATVSPFIFALTSLRQLRCSGSPSANEELSPAIAKLREWVSFDVVFPHILPPSIERKTRSLVHN